MPGEASASSGPPPGASSTAHTAGVSLRTIPAPRMTAPGCSHRADERPASPDIVAGVELWGERGALVRMKRLSAAGSADNACMHAVLIAV